MLKQLIYKIAAHRHPWREMKFDELAELYTSMTLRSLGFGIIGIFVPIYLYQSGVSLQDIFLFYGLFFLLRIPVAYGTAFLVGRIGPKHTIAVSTIIFIFFLSLLLSYSQFQWPLLMLSFWFTLANGLFFIAYNTDFSKINHKKHGGKELGWLYIFERAGFALGPVVGGLIASYIAPELTILVAILVLLLSLLPLFMTKEPVKTHQHVEFSSFGLKKHTANYVALAAFNIENFASTALWPLFIGVYIFTDDTYAKLGGLIGASMVVSMFSARMFGKFIDARKGRYLLNHGVVINAITHGLRSIITSAPGAIGISIVNEPTTLSYRMPLLKGYYDAADSHEKDRIVYITWMEIISAAAKSFFCFSLYALAFFYEAVTMLQYSFIFVGAISLLILVQRFPALKKV